MTAEQPDATLDGLLEFVREARGFDFTGYKRSSVERRVAKRMQALGIKRYDDYLDHLELHSEEFIQLFNTLLINVTAFFRDPQTWEYMAEEIVPSLLGTRPPDAPIRIWCAGVASGEEAYTVAMVLARALGEEQFRARVKIYATDLDDEALDVARHGAYVPRQVENVPQDALERFFERAGQRYLFRKELRRSVIFGRNDLVQDAPISRIDLLVCRNTLMYFAHETQTQILRRFHFALDDGGFLLLGKSEMLITHGDLFTPVDLKRRVFRKVAKPTLSDRVRVIARDAASASAGAVDDLREAAFDISGAAQVVFDVNGILLMANNSARRLFGLNPTDLGRPVQDLELSYRPVELRSHLDAIQRELRPIDVSGVPWRVGDSERVLDVRITPLLGEGTLFGTSVTFADVTESHALQEELSNSKRDLEHAYEELQSTVEELETTNEELQSTNEELETTNEELQSSNEELETMNEELRHRTDELHEINAFLETILTTIGLAVAVIDRHQHVQVWNGKARDLWGLTAEEVEDRHALSLDVGLPVEKLGPHLRATLLGDSDYEQIVVDATNRRGQPFQCRVTFTPMRGSNDGGPSGVIMTMEPVDG